MQKTAVLQMHDAILNDCHENIIITPENHCMQLDSFWFRI